METIQREEFEQVHDETSAPSISVDAGVSVSGGQSLQNTLESNAESLNVDGFKCTDCGLAHSHDTTKHRASDALGLGDEEAASMDWNPNCHCGYNEAAYRGIAGVSPSQAAQTAPIPDKTEREMEQAF